MFTVDMAHQSVGNNILLQVVSVFCLLLFNYDFVRTFKTETNDAPGGAVSNMMVAALKEKPLMLPAMTYMLRDVSETLLLMPSNGISNVVDQINRNHMIVQLRWLLKDPNLCRKKLIGTRIPMIGKYSLPFSSE